MEDQPAHGEGAPTWAAYLARNLLRYAEKFTESQDYFTAIPGLPDVGNAYRAEVTMTLLQQVRDFLNEAARLMAVDEVRAGHLSQKKVADVLHVHQATVGRWVKDPAQEGDAGYDTDEDPRTLDDGDLMQRIITMSFRFIDYALADPQESQRLRNHLERMHLEQTGRQPEQDVLDTFKEYRRQMYGFVPREVR